MLFCELLVSIGLTSSEQNHTGSRLANPHTKATSTVWSRTKSAPAWWVLGGAKPRQSGHNVRE